MLRFFRPRWQHPNAETRLNAVSSITPGTPENDAILEKIAQEDEHPNVRFEAILKISDVTRVINFKGRPSDGPQALKFQKHLCECLVSAKNIDNIPAAIALIHEEDLLLHIAINAKTPALQTAILDRISGQDALAMLVRSINNAQCRRLAAERIHDIELIEQLLKDVQGKDKQTYRTLKTKLDNHRLKIKQQHALHQECTELAEKIEHLNKIEFNQYFEAKYLAFQKQWLNLVEQLQDSELAHRGQFALSQCELTLTRIREAQQAEQEQLKQQKQALEAQETVLVSLHTLKVSIEDHCKNNFADTTITHLIDANKEQLSQQALIWQATTKLAGDDAQIRFDRLTSDIEHVNSALSRFAEQEETLRQLATDDEAKTAEIKAAIIPLKWPKTLTAPVILQQLNTKIDQAEKATRVRRQQEKVKNAQDFEPLTQLLNACSEAIEQGQSRDATKLLKSADQEAQQLKRLPSQLDNRYKHITAQVRSLESWSGYAAEPKKRQICEQMEALVERELEPNAKAEKIKELQKQWRLIDSTDPVHARDLWLRFKKASDLAYAPCEIHFKEQRLVREQNLVLRKQMISALTETLEAQDWETWRYNEAVSLLNSQRKQWNTHRPVDRSPNKKLQAQFDALLQQIETHLTKIRELHHQTKTDLLASAQSIAEQDEITNQDLSKVKQLQQTWKALGEELPHQDRKLWKQFKVSCNQTFERYSEQKRQHDDQKADLDSIINELETATSTITPIAVLQELLTKANNLKASDNTFPHNGIKQLDAAIRPIQALIDKANRFSTPEYQSIERFSLLCKQLEDAIIEGTASEVLPSLEKAWLSGTRAPKEYQDSLDARFAFAQAALEVDDETLQAAILGQEVLLRQLCLRLEIALGLPSPDEDQALRMEYQMARLQQAISQQSEDVDISDIIRLKYEWASIPFAGHYEDLTIRFQTALSRL